MDITRARIRSSTMVCSTVLVEAAESIVPMPTRNSIGRASQSELVKVEHDQREARGRRR